MLTYAELKEKPKEFLAATGLYPEEFEQILPVFAKELAVIVPPLEQTKGGQPRKRVKGAGPKERLGTAEDKLLFILVYQKTYPLQTMHGLQFRLSQPLSKFVRCAQRQNMVMLLRSCVKTTSVFQACFARKWSKK
jgi:hypothetical protein